MDCEYTRHNQLNVGEDYPTTTAPPSVAHLYGANGAPSWGDWNSVSGGQGYWLIGTSVLLVIIGVVMITSKPPMTG